MIKKDVGVESLRVYAIILIVVCHASCFGGHPLLYLFNSAGEPIRLALFSVISGYIYSLRPIQNNLLVFMKGKAKRILIPMFSLTLIVSCLKLNINDPLYYFKNLLIGQPANQYWFLAALFIIFILIGTCDQLKLLNRFQNWVALFIFSLCFSRSQPFSYHFLWGVNYLFLFFLFGYGLNKFNEKFDGIKPMKIAFIFFASLVLFSYFKINELFFFDEPQWGSSKVYINDSQYISTDRNSLLQTIYGLSGILILFKIRHYLPDLSRYASYVFPIFLFHFQIQEVISVCLAHTETRFFLKFAISCLSCYFGSVYLCQLIRKFQLLSLLLLGERKEQSLNLTSTID
jgi:hypothetical protein